MSGNGHLDARKIRGQLGHPIVDADGHWLEYGPMTKGTAVEKQTAQVLARNGGRT